MQKLITELQRLYFHDRQLACSHRFSDGDATVDEACPSPLIALSPALLADCLNGESRVAISLLGAEQSVRAMVLSVERVSDWEAVASVFHGVQNDLDLPAPAIAVSGNKGFGIWFSLADSLSLDDAKSFLTALCHEYLADIAGAKLELLPSEAATLLALVPAFQPLSGKWSAFIDPSMGSMFIDEPGLDMAPNMDRQAEMLAGLRSITRSEFQQALSRLQAMQAERLEQADVMAQVSASRCLPGGPCDSYQDPRNFLLAVMNDTGVTIEHRVEAAKALLPYFSGRWPD